MNKNLIPTYVKDSVFNLNIEDLFMRGYKVLICDLDNTLATPYTANADQRVIDLSEKLKNKKINFVIVSNNNIKRVENFCKDLNILYLANAKKPNSKRLKQFLKQNHLENEKILYVGDQIMTDVNLANKLKIDVCLVLPLSKKDEPITFFPRLLDKYFRKKLNKKNLLKEF